MNLCISEFISFNNYKIQDKTQNCRINENDKQKEYFVQFVKKVNIFGRAIFEMGLKEGRDFWMKRRQRNLPMRWETKVKLIKLE